MATVDNLIADIQIRTPGVVLEMVERELYLVACDFSAEVLSTSHPTSDDEPSEWLTDAQYIANYLLLLHGVMARLLIQKDRPYHDPDMAAAHATLYADLMAKARGTAQADPSTAIERVVNGVRADLPGTRDAVIHLAFMEALDEFLNKTNTWSEDIAFASVVDQTEYTITPTDGRITRLLAAYETASERAIKADMPTPGTLRLGWDPATVENFTATVGLSIVPGDTVAAVDAPSWLIDRYHLPLKHGTLSVMQMQTAKPYSNERMGIYNGRKFRSQMAIAAAERRQAFKYRQQPWQFPQGTARVRRVR